MSCCSSIRARRSPFVRSGLVPADHPAADDMEGMRLGNDHLSGSAFCCRCRAVRGGDDRRSEPLEADLAHHAACDPQHDRHPAHPANGQRARQRLRADLSDAESAQPLGRGSVRHLRLCDGHHARRVQLQHGGRPVQVRRRHHPRAGDELAGQKFGESGLY